MKIIPLILLPQNRLLEMILCRWEPGSRGPGLARATVLSENAFEIYSANGYLLSTRYVPSTELALGV